MKLELEVLASVSIKRKKPWPRVVFLGEEQESLFLIDKELQRLSVLYVPSGKTKRKIPRLTPMLPNVVSLNTTDNGQFICGLLNSGDLFLWHKDSDTVKFIKGLPEFRHKIASARAEDEVLDHKHEPFFHMSGDATKLILVLNLTNICVWEMDPGQLFFKFRKGKLDKQSHLQGSWTSVMSTIDTPLPEPHCREVSLDATFFVSEGVYGLCCSLVYVFTRSDCISVSTLLIKWFDAQNITNWSAPVFHSEWTSIQYPLTSIAPNVQPVHSKGAYINKISHDGQLVAIAINQACSHDNRMLFVSPWTDTVVVANMRGCGARVHVTANHRTYWVTDLAWTFDDLFVACAINQGTLCFLTRLGEPALLQTFGCSIEMGPKPFMPLHPVISIRSPHLDHRPGADNVRASIEEVKDPKRQRFSISSHPSLPIVIFSDGYMVTVIYLPGEPTCLSLMKGLSMEASHNLRKIRETQRTEISLFDRLKIKNESVKKSSLKVKDCERSAHRLGLMAGNNLAKKTRFSDGVQKYHFEEVPVDVLDNNYDSEIEGESSPQIAGIDQGVLDFGDIANLNTTLDYKKLDWDEGLTLSELISRTQSALVLAWNLGASHTGLWTLDHENVMENVADNLINLFAVLLYTKAKVLKKVGNLVSTILNKSQRKAFPKKSNKKLILVLNLYKSLMHTLRLDGHSRHLMVCATRFTYANIRMLLSCDTLSLKEAKSKTLHGCYMVLQFAEAALGRIYTSIPSDLPWQNESAHSPTDAYQPAIFVYTAHSRENTRTDVAFMHDSDQTEVKTQMEDSQAYAGQLEDLNGGVIPVELKGVQRLGIAWLVLYKAAVESYRTIKQLKDSSEVNKPAKLKAEMRKIWSVIMLLQTKIHALGLRLPLRNKFALTEAEHKLVEGDDMKGEVLVVRELGAAPEPSIQGTKGCRMLLSMVYNLVGRGRLRSALELVEFLIRQTDVKKAVEMSRQDTKTKVALLSLLQQVPYENRALPATMIQNSAVRHTVQSMARLMAAYFSNRELFIYPAHAPRKLPPLHVHINNTENRVLPLSREALTSKLTEESLGEAWTTDKALEYLLLCGALPEAVWFASQLGDWKTAVMIGVAVTQHQQMCPLLYSKKNKLQLPAELHPENIMKNKLDSVSGTDEGSDKRGDLLRSLELSPDMSAASVNDFLLCASLCDLNFVPSLLAVLTKKLKSVASQFSALVPDSLYLPAPPVYCPQPTPTDESRIPHAVLVEIQLRKEVSTLVQSLLLVLSSAHCCLPSARWYIHKLMHATATKATKITKWKSVERVSADIRVLHDSFLSENSVFTDNEEDSDIHMVLACFRDMCSVMWMLHARDQLSRGLRKKTYSRQKMLKRCSEFSMDQWEQQCQSALQWAIHLMPFTHFLTEADLQISSILFSLIIEMKADDHAAKTLAEQFFDTESLHPEIQDKLQWLMKDWKKITVRNKSKSVSLATYYEKACEKFEKVVKRKQKVFGSYEFKVFNINEKSSTSLEVDETLYIGSRSFESENNFLQFLDEFYAVSFNKLVDAENETGTQVPLLPRYRKEVKEKELYSDLHQAVTNFQKKHEFTESLTRIKHKTRTPTNSKQEASTSRCRKSEKEKGKQKDYAGHNLAKRGLLRSRSFSEIRGNSSTFDSSEWSPLAEKMLSKEYLVEDVVDLPPITPREDVLHSPQMNSSTPRQKTSTPRKSKKAAYTHTARELQRSVSATELNEGSVKSLTKLSMGGPDPLASPVLEPCILENLVFEKKYTRLECLLDWLSRWVTRNQMFAQPDASPRKQSQQQSVIRIRIPTRMLLYSVWQLEHNYNQVLLQQTKKGRERPYCGLQRRMESRSPSPVQKKVASRCRSPEQRGISPSTTELYIVEHVTTDGGGQTLKKAAHGNNQVDPTDRDRRRKAAKKRNTKNSKRKPLDEHCDVEISVPVHSIDLPDRPLSQVPLLYTLENKDILKDTSHRKKQLRIKDKSLDIILNDRFVYDMNVNQNNGNNDENPTEENLTMDDSPRTPTKESMNVGHVDRLTAAKHRSEHAVDNINQNISSRRHHNESSDSIIDTIEQGVSSQAEIGRQVGKLVAERIQQQGRLGQSTDALISSLSEMIDEELKKTMLTLARFDKQELEISSPIPQDTVDGAEHIPLLSQPRAHTTQLPSETPQYTTFPFGSGAKGAMTDRSLLSNNSTVAEEFRTIVRTELKKLIQAQHKGILTMLDSLEDQAEGQNKSVAKSDKLPQQFDPFNPHESKPLLKPQECVILTAQQSGATPSGELSKSQYDDETLTPVSSLSGSEMYTDRTPLQDRPLTMSQLKANDSPILKPKHQYHRGAAGSHVNGALKELHNLSHKYQTTVGGHPPPHPQTNHPQHAVTEKENWSTHVSSSYSGQLGGSAVGPPLLQHQDHQQPFDRLMHMLRQFNSEVGGPRGAMPPLLKLGETQQLRHTTRFPPLPTHAWPTERHEALLQSTAPNGIPFLTREMPYQNQSMAEQQRFEQPERDDQSHPGNPSSQQGAPPPLLRAEWVAEPFLQPRDQYGTPRLIPPQQLLHYEQIKYNKTEHRKKLLQEQIDEKLRQVSGKPDKLGTRLLRPDTMEPFAEKDDRDHEARQRRRQIKLCKPGEKKSKKSKDRQNESAGKVQREVKPCEVSNSEASDEASLIEEQAEESVPSQHSSEPTKQGNSEVGNGGRHEELQQLQHGYAITPGLFDEYLSQEDQAASLLHNYASMQHHAVSLMLRENKKLQAGKNSTSVATETTEDKVTTITKAAATNPVGEAISRYYRAKTGTNASNILPPDIYMGLRFTDTHQGQSSVSNAFLNVVDIHSSEMLSEIAASLPEREPHEVKPQALDMHGTPIQPKPNLKSPRHHKAVGALQEVPTRDRSPSPRRPAPDSVTLELLGQPTHPGAPADEVVAGYRRRTGAHIKKKLMDMDQQFDAIETMSQNIKDDFKHTKVLLHTIEQMGEAIDPAQSPQPQSASYSSPHRSPHTPRFIPVEGDTVSTEQELKPSFVKKAYQREEETTQAAFTPISSTPRLVPRDRLTVQERIKEIRSSIQTDGLRWSGISDVDDIIGEVVAKGDLDATEFGFSHRDVELLTARTLYSARQGKEVTNQELEDIFRKTSPRHMAKRTSAEQQKLQEFMERKRRERMREYRQELNLKRDKEQNPFNSKPLTNTLNNVHSKDLSEAEKLRLTNKQKREEDFSKEREREATLLMRDILEDKLPEQPVNCMVTLKKEKSSNIRAISPLGRTKTTKPVSDQSAVRYNQRKTERKVARSPERAQTTYSHDSARQIHGRPGHKSRLDRKAEPGSRSQIPHSTSDRRVIQPMKKSLEFSGEDQIRVFGMEQEFEETTKHPTEEPIQQEKKKNQEVYKPQSFTDIVKMQKPEVLRETRNRSHKPVPYVERLSEMSIASTWRSEQPASVNQQRIQGSKRLKGSAKAQERIAQRVVKTYQERLHEMKQTKQYTTPIISNGPSSGQPRTNPLQPTKKTVSRKGKTYSEQLKALQPPKHQYRSGVAGVRRSQQPVRRSHGPVHSPKTYTQQLQELQPHTGKSSEYYDGKAYRTVGTNHRGAARLRPYADPYSETTHPEDGDSTLSPWSMEQDVKKLLYNGDDASSRSPGTEMDLSQLSDYDLELGADYASLVPVDEIMEVASIGSASVMSFIDWDQVDDIIADVH